MLLNDGRFGWSGELARLSGIWGSAVTRDTLAMALTDAVVGNGVAVQARELVSKGIDLTFSASKAVSVYALVHGDVNHLVAMDRAVDRAMLIVERYYAKTRVLGEVKYTRNIAWASFRHDMNRNAEPHLHYHVIVPNRTDYNGKQYALDMREIFDGEWCLLIGQYFRNFLCQELVEMGYDYWIDKETGHLMSPVEMVAREVFGTRRAQIESYLMRKFGITIQEATSAQRKYAVLGSRRKKLTGKVAKNA